MKKAVWFIHGRSGFASEAEHYIPLFEGYDVIGFDYESRLPWEAEKEFPAEYKRLSEKYDSITVVAISIGAYYTLCNLGLEKIERAFLISPIVDMENVVSGMMKMANVTEDELREKSIIETDFGETLSWQYYTYVKEHPIKWNIPTDILYGENDNFTDIGTMRSFAEKINATLTVMKGGEHWFHTDEEMKFLDEWIDEKKAAR